MRHMKNHVGAQPDNTVEELCLVAKVYGNSGRPDAPTPEDPAVAEPEQAAEALVQSSEPSATAEQPTTHISRHPPIPAKPVPVGSVARATYKEKHPDIAAITTPRERRHYLANLFRLGRFDGLRTAGLLGMIWDDLGPLEFAELVSDAAIETNFRRGSEQARRVVLLGKVERLFKKAMANGDLKTAARLLETWAKLDVPVGVDMMTAMLGQEAWRVIAPKLLAKYPMVFEEMHRELVAEEARKRQALAPASVVESDHAAE